MLWGGEQNASDDAWEEKEMNFRCGRKKTKLETCFDTSKELLYFLEDFPDSNEMSKVRTQCCFIFLNKIFFWNM